MTTIEQISSFDDLVHLLIRPYEPVFYGRGPISNKVYYMVTEQFLVHPYQNDALNLLNRDTRDGRRIAINDPSNALLQEINDILTRSRTILTSSQFSHFVPKHQEVAGFLIEKFMRYSLADLATVAAYVRDRINRDLFFYAFTTALLHRKDANLQNLPTYAQAFPQKFIRREAIRSAKAVSTVFPNNIPERIQIAISSDFTGNDSDPEHLLAYFREDLGINAHHWHWHQIYPTNAGPNNDMIVRKDRRGELFYYMHHQIVSRYNVERLCLGMDLVERLMNWKDPVPEAYFPMLNNTNSGRSYSARPNNLRLNDVNRPEQTFDIDDMVRRRERLYEAIHRREVLLPNGDKIRIDNDQGIDILGNLVESTTLSLNRDFYGDLHNTGHNAISFMHDPINKYNQPAGVMFETSTAMRDTIFYRWHATIDDLFTEHKDTLPPYDKDRDLNFSSVQIIDLAVYTCSGTHYREQNNLYTYMMKSDFNIESGLDFSASGSLFIKVTHLNHDNFEYRINVNNTSQIRINGVVRIFMAPTHGVRNINLNFVQQKQLMIELDRFGVELEPGRNLIKRQSYQSSLIISLNQIFPDSPVQVNTGSPNTNTGNSNDVNTIFANNSGTTNTTLNNSSNTFTLNPNLNQINTSQNTNYCQCGWPENMLIPRGTETGYSMVLFAMISDFEKDKVVEDTRIPPQTCKDAMIFCGLKDRKYPDRRTMGYPFDRPVASEIRTIENFITPNMKVTPIKIFFSPEVRDNTISPAAASVATTSNNNNGDTSGTLVTVFN